MISCMFMSWRHGQNLAQHFNLVLKTTKIDDFHFSNIALARHKNIYFAKS